MYYLCLLFLIFTLNFLFLFHLFFYSHLSPSPPPCLMIFHLWAYATQRGYGPLTTGGAHHPALAECHRAYSQAESTNQLFLNLHQQHPLLQQPSSSSSSPPHLTLSCTPVPARRTTSPSNPAVVSSTSRHRSASSSPPSAEAEGGPVPVIEFPDDEVFSQQLFWPKKKQTLFSGCAD